MLIVILGMQFRCKECCVEELYVSLLISVVDLTLYSIYIEELFFLSAVIYFISTGHKVSPPNEQSILFNGIVTFKVFLLFLVLFIIQSCLNYVYIEYHAQCQ